MSGKEKEIESLTKNKDFIQNKDTCTENKEQDKDILQIG